MKHRIAMQGESFSSNEVVRRKEKSWDLHPFFPLFFLFSSFLLFNFMYQPFCKQASRGWNARFESQKEISRNYFKLSWFHILCNPFSDFFYFIFPVEDDNGCCFYVRYCKIKLRFFFFFPREILTFSVSSVKKLKHLIFYNYFIFSFGFFYCYINCKIFLLSYLM